MSRMCFSSFHFILTHSGHKSIIQNRHWVSSNHLYNHGRIHTGFHRLTEIGQIFHNKDIFNNNNNRTFKVEIWKMVWTNVFFFQFLGIRQKPGKGNFRDLKFQNIPRGACPRAPLEACSLGPSFRKSVSIYPRSAPDNCI